MSTLITAPLAPLLDSLFRKDEEALLATDSTVLFSDKEREQRMRSKTGYLDFYSCLKDLPLAVSRDTGTLLYMLTRTIGARAIVEFGTSFGISTLCLAAAL